MQLAIMNSWRTTSVGVKVLANLTLIAACSEQADAPADAEMAVGTSPSATIAATGAATSSTASNAATTPAATDASSSATDSASTAAPQGCAPQEIVITDETNYSFSNTLNIARTTLKDGVDLTFDWSGLTEDFFGKPFDPLADVDVGLISLWGMTPSELEGNIRDDNLPLSVNKGAITTYPAGQYATQNLLSFDLLGEPFSEEELWAFFDTSDPGFQYPQDTHTFMFMVSTGQTLGKGARMLHFFNLDPTSENTELVLTNDSTVLEYSVDLESAMPVLVPANTAELNFDWGEMTTNALGNDYPAAQINEAVVAHYDSLTLAELEEQFLFLEELADGWWGGEIKAGDNVNLSELSDASGAAFPGVDESGVWMVALFCTANCSNPAPWSITLLQACN